MENQNSLLSARVESISCEYEEYQRTAALKLANVCNGQSRLRKKLQAKHAEAKSLIRDLQKENGRLKTHILATSPRKTRKKLKKRKRKTKKPWLIGTGRKTYSVPGTVSRKMREQTQLLKTKKKKRKTKRKKKVVKVPQIENGSVSSSANEVLQVLSPLARRRDHLEQVIKSLEIEMNDLQNKYVKTLKHQEKSDSPLSADVKEILLSLENKQDQISNLKRHRIYVLSEIKSRET